MQVKKVCSSSLARDMTVKKEIDYTPSHSERGEGFGGKGNIESQKHLLGLLL